MKIYLARPISGKTKDNVFDNYLRTIEWLSGRNVQILCPMMGKNFLRTDPNEKYKPVDNLHPITTNHAIFERDIWMVKQSDVIFMDLIDADHVSIGCIMELAIAASEEKHTILAMEEGNIHEHAFVVEAADIRFYTYDDAIEYLLKLTISEPIPLANMLRQVES